MANLTSGARTQGEQEVIDAIERDLLGFVGYTAVEEKSMNDTMTLSERADALEEKMSRELDYIVIKSRLYSMAEGDMSPAPNAGALMAKHPNARVLMGEDPRLPPMPEKPTLIDFFKYRFGPAAHLLQSAKHAVNAGLPEKMVLACLLHDISTIGFIRGDHRRLYVSPYLPDSRFRQRLPALVWKIRLLHGAQTRLVQNAAIAGDAPGTLSRLGTERIQGQCAALLKITQEVPVCLQACHGGQRGEPGRRPRHPAAPV